jgi:predicted Zn-dependent peptidase
VPARDPFKKTVFANGLTLVTERQPQFRSLSIGIWVKAGTRHERPSEAGVSHFLEHMLFKGTGTRSALDIAREVDRVGGEFNAFTAREYTCFHILLLGRDLGLAIDILSDILLDSKFDAEELERERRVILQEIAMVEENPEELAHDLFFERIYGGRGRSAHGLGKPILGTESSIRRMKRAEVVRYFRERYRPDQLIVAVAGDVSHEAVSRKLGALTRKRWPGRPEGKAPPNAYAVAPPALKSGFWWSPRATEQVHLIWGVRGPSYSSNDRFAAFLLNVYLGGGMSSALFQEIREKNALAYSVYSSLTPFRDSGTFNVYAATGLAQVPLCLRLIEESVDKLQKEFLSDDELRVIQDNFKGTVLLSADSAESRMSSIARNEIFFGRYVPVEEICARIDEVTPESLRRVARKWMNGGRSVLALGPRPPKRIKSKLMPEII